MSEYHMNIPEGMVAVSKEQFFKALEADVRDIMPSVIDPYQTTWETRSRILWGWTKPGWKSPYDQKKVYAVYPEALKGQTDDTR